MPGPLSAAHEGLEDPDSCDSCHTAELEVDGDRCLVCHDQIAARLRAGKGVHREVGVGDCAICHVEHQGRDADLRPIDREGFDHAGETGFALEGFHGEFAGDCSSCHTTRSFLNLAPGCATCHQDAHQGSLDDDCTACHATDTHFKNASRAFHKSTVLPLEGRHLDVPCVSCHWNGVMKGTPTRCLDCHWIRRQDDPFRTRLGVDCENCHTPIGWIPARWNHEANTGYRIGGQHLTVGCEGCHPDRRFDQPADPDCYSCHLDDYNSTSDPDHQSAGFPTDCDACHQPTTWTGATFDHPYSLVGVHATLDCADCHSGGVYAGTPTDCVGCHLDDYNGAADPDHAAAGFSTDCDSCHRQSDPDWSQASYPHSVWPLVGSHIAEPCSSCHIGNVYAGLPSDCVDCHLDDYNSTSDPDHQSAGFPTDCDACHQPTTWTAATFDHPYSLVGVHATLDCADCHSGGVYAGTPTECVGCHLDDYNGAADPDHASAGFPTDCEFCHRQSDMSWDQGTFEHTYFPINSGQHAGTECSDCHRSPSNFTAFSCLSGGCHPRSEVDEIHEGENGYVYDSAACYSCHPDGRPPQDAAFRMRPSHG